MGITAGEYILGFATVDLGYLYNVFAFIHCKDQGIIFESDDKALGISNRMNGIEPHAMIEQEKTTC